ncbi:MAG: NAD-dependent succinate-semialdehyde dehydrogenase [Alphaproteobacteria bacterium]|nr:NAD-dependent succinate-semialdehyde dehydrogenase [Alphaproteobacteria bacterium]
MKLKHEDFLKDRAYIGGNWIKADGGKSFEVFNPADNSIISAVPDMGEKETLNAIQAADNALKGWSSLSAKKRAVVLKKWSELLIYYADFLAVLMTLEQGKPIAEAKSEVLYGADFFEWYAEEGKRAYGDIIPSPIDGARILVTKQAIGVCGIITPWNFPSAMIARKVAPALAAGCTVVCKPAEDTPLSALALAVLAEEAGLPAGVFNVVTGKDPVPIARAICMSDIVKKVSFTGSNEVGKVLMRTCSKTLKKISLELGGNAPFIVFDDADVEQAVEGAIISKYRNAGQTCICANRIYVHESVYDSFVEKFVAKVKMLKVGSGLDSKSVIGPLINEAAIQKVQEHIEDAISKGAKLVLGGSVHKLGHTFFEPTVLTDMNAEMRIATEEVFAPVAPIFKFKNEQKVIDLANATHYGLAAYFYSRDMARVWHVVESLEYGIVAVNTGSLSTEVAPFGGIKESGIGREGSKYGLDEYMELKYVLMSGLKQ